MRIASALLQKLLKESRAGHSINQQQFVKRLQLATEIVGGLESYIADQTSNASVWKALQPSAAVWQSSVDRGADGLCGELARGPLRVFNHDT